MHEHYQIRVYGFLGPLLRMALGGLRHRTLPRQCTIRGKLTDADLQRLLTRLDRSGVEVICLRRVAGVSSAADGVPADARPHDRSATSNPLTWERS
ncbi:hypothetical protein QLQ12_42315 [Actinoplanes sp. NEAU-A12]|uniref:Uncharacterized protein n=1 Tax=Actinoplanes sandaracinus TaxID=3045177 RepID=A0ABT6WZS3_9ACTN|nr:hypothetical protein [Actinoplanes sandaracinus]MDI6105239.1 hypothetical protein [Actinoplanes sandaracinus]